MMMPQHDELPAADRTPASIQQRRHLDDSGHVALLAATALGFVYAPTGDNETQTRRLVALAGPIPESLARAQTAVLALEVGSAQARREAAALLRRATRNVVGPCSAVLAGGRSDAGTRTANTEVRT